MITKDRIERLMAYLSGRYAGATCLSFEVWTNGHKSKTPWQLFLGREANPRLMEFPSFRAVEEWAFGVDEVMEDGGDK